MIAREPLKPGSFFDHKINFMKQADMEYEEVLNNPETTPLHCNRLLYVLFHDAIKLLIAKYSTGFSVGDLKLFFPDIVLRRERHQKALGRLGTDFKAIDDYTLSIWLVCLAILLDIDDLLFDRLLKCIGNEGSDQLFERIVEVRVKGRLKSTELMWPKPYQSLYDAIDATAKDQSNLISKFLKTWYSSYGKLHVYWHDSHKRPNGGGFVGYWCFEAAAVVKAFKINDSAFLEAPYYPKDLVHVS